ncbi:hypothetical protein [Arthrobacter sp. R4-81]
MIANRRGHDPEPEGILGKPCARPDEAWTILGKPCAADSDRGGAASGQHEQFSASPRESVACRRGEWHLESVADQAGNLLAVIGLELTTALLASTVIARLRATERAAHPLH